MNSMFSILPAETLACARCICKSVAKTLGFPSIYRHFVLLGPWWTSRLLEILLKPFPALCKWTILNRRSSESSFCSRHGSHQAMRLQTSKLKPGVCVFDLTPDSHYLWGVITAGAHILLPPCTVCPIGVYFKQTVCLLCRNPANSKGFTTLPTLPLCWLTFHHL